MKKARSLNSLLSGLDQTIIWAGRLTLPDGWSNAKSEIMEAYLPRIGKKDESRETSPLVLSPMGSNDRECKDEYYEVVLPGKDWQHLTKAIDRLSQWKCEVQTWTLIPLPEGSSLLRLVVSLKDGIISARVYRGRNVTVFDSAVVLEGASARL